jgi:hypothetical protein
MAPLCLGEALRREFSQNKVVVFQDSDVSNTDFLPYTDHGFLSGNPFTKKE